MTWKAKWWNCYKTELKKKKIRTVYKTSGKTLNAQSYDRGPRKRRERKGLRKYLKR